jgi:hypothetical protein
LIGGCGLDFSGAEKDAVVSSYMKDIEPLGSIRGGIYDSTYRTTSVFIMV